MSQEGAEVSPREEVTEQEVAHEELTEAQTDTRPDNTSNTDKPQSPASPQQVKISTSPRTTHF